MCSRVVCSIHTLGFGRHVRITQGRHHQRTPPADIAAAVVSLALPQLFELYTWLAIGQSLRDARVHGAVLREHTPATVAELHEAYPRLRDADLGWLFSQVSTLRMAANDIAYGIVGLPLQWGDESDGESDVGEGLLRRRKETYPASRTQRFWLCMPQKEARAAS
jgi:hypothetical protein